jgi:hypothetical protein
MVAVATGWPGGFDRLAHVGDLGAGRLSIETISPPEGVST